MVLPPGGSRASYSIVLNRLLFFFGLFILHMHDLGSRFAEKSEKSLADKTLGSKGIARQQWRARIETIKSYYFCRRCCRIARQQWRARIETFVRYA